MAGRYSTTHGGKNMKYKKILDTLEKIHCIAQEIENEIKPYQLENEGLKHMFEELFTEIETVRNPLFDIVHCFDKGRE